LLLKYSDAMSEGFQFLDVILFAIVAGFLILRLRIVLGRRDGHQGRPSDPFAPRPRPEPPEDNVVPLPDRKERPGEVVPPVAPEALAGNGRGRLDAGLKQIAIADPRFEPEEFVSGARIAFELIVNAFAAGDAESLEPLLSPEVFSNFNQSIRERAAASERLETKLVSLLSAELVEAYMAGRTSHVTVKFVSEQISALYNAAGEVIDGDPAAVTEVTDFWTFARDTRSSDPNWMLVATGSLD
jgi:predicted lipid-binding transport protein (Tim44 family)